MNSKQKEKDFPSIFNGVETKCKQLLNSFAALCGGNKKMKIVLSVAGAILCSLIILTIVLCGGGNAKETALKNIPTHATSAYMLEYNSKYDFKDEPSGDILPHNGIVILYQTYNNFEVLVCKSNGKVIEEFDNNLTQEKILDAKYPGEDLLYKADLEFITECLEGCIRVSSVTEEQETNKWYKFSDDEIKR